MKRLALVLLLTAGASLAEASWYWPFGGGKDGPSKRISDLVEDADLAIDEATHFSAEGMVDKAVEQYRIALAELDRVEAENPDRAATPEFVSVKNKRAYVQSAIDSLLLKQARDNAQSVVVTDTAELERKLTEERAAKAKAEAQAKEEAEAEAKEEAKVSEAKAKVEAEVKEEVKAKPKFAVKTDGGPLTRSEKLKTVGAAIGNKDYDRAAKLIDELLFEKPNDGAALNLRAAMEAAKGDLKAAEKTLDWAITSNPRSYHAYYNMAKLKLQLDPEATRTAKYYYESGRAFGGPRNPDLEKAVMK